MYPAKFWNGNTDKSVKCVLCPHNCHIPAGKAGICGGRENIDGRLCATAAGLVSAVALDPLEKKPLRRFHPGKQILSLGGFGCNFHCPFCQNCHISLEYDQEEGERLKPERILALARQTVPAGNVGVAYTYNEPLIGYEFVWDCAGMIHEAGLFNVIVTNGYINARPLAELMPYIDAMNIDLKAFTPEFYRHIGGDLEAVKDTIAYACRHTHVEITTLVIPGENEDDIAALARWLAFLDPDIPLHLTRFVPRYRYADKAPTSAETISRLFETAKQFLNYVYI